LEVLETIKRLRPATEVIVITAHASLDTAVRALRDGAYDLITKPLPEIEALYRVVDRALEKGRLSEENLLLVSNLQARNIEKTDLRALRTGGRYSTSSFMITPLTVSYPIRYQRRRVGVINVSDKHSGEPFNEQDLEFLSTLASQMAAAIENARLVEELEDGYLGALVGLIQAMEESRPESRGHSQRVAGLSAAVARELAMPQE